jgi:hypothetical protein
MSLLIGIKNTTSQTVPALGTIDIGSVYRRYYKKNNCGVRTFDTTSTSVSLQQQGIYHITATAVVSAPAAGDVTVQLLINGDTVPGAFATETITTATTEFRTLVIDYYTLVDDVDLLGISSTAVDTISFQNTGIAATFTSFIVNIEKAV